MDDTNKVVVQLIGDIGDFKTTLQAGVAALMESGKQMVASMRPISDQLNIVAQSNARIYATLNTAMQQSAEQARKSTFAITSSVGAMASSISSAIRQSNATISASMQQMAAASTAATSQINSSYSAMAQSINSLSTSLNLNIQRTREELLANSTSLRSSAAAHGAHAGAVGVNSTAMREFLVVMREAARGDTTRLAGSLTILAQQFDLTSRIISGLFSPMGALAVAMAAVAYEAHRGWIEQRDFANALQITGNKAGMTEDGFNKLANTLSSKTNTSIGKTREVLNTLVASGEFTTKTTKLMAEAAIDFGHKSGIGVDEALQKFMEADKGVAKTAYELNRNYAVLTVAEAKRIKNLDDMGLKDQAEAVLMQAVIDKTKKMNENLGYLESTWRSLTTAISAATQALMNWGKVPTKNDRLEDLKKEEAQIKKNIAEGRSYVSMGAGRSTGKSIDEHQALAAIQEKIKGLTSEIAGDETKATKEAKDRAATQKQVADILKPPKENKEKGQSTNSQEDRKGLLEYLNAQEDAAIAQHRIYNEREEDTATFWAKEKDRYAAGTSDRMRAEIAYQSAILAIKKSGQQADLATIREEMAQDRTSIEQKIALANKIADMNFNPKAGATQSKAYIDALAYIDGLEKQQAAERIKEQQDVYKGFATTELEKVDDVRAALKIQLDEHKISSAQYLEVMRIEAARELEIKKKLLDDELALEVGKGGGADIAKIESLNNQKLALDRAYNKQLIANSEQSAKASQKPWDDAANTFGNAMGSRLDSALRKQISYGQAVRYSVGDLVSYELKEGEKWLFHKALMYGKDLLFHTSVETEKTLATTVGETTRLSVTAAASSEGLAIKAAHAVAQIAMDAWTAMAGAYAAIAAIPYVGPVLAPVAAAAAFAGVIAISHNIASAEGGMEVPRGVNPIVQVHEEEKILPKGPSRTLDTLQSMLSSGAAMGGKGGDTHHHWNVAPNQDFFGKSPMQVQRATAQAMKRVR